MVNNHFVQSLSNIIKSISSLGVTQVNFTLRGSLSARFNFSKITAADVESAIASMFNSASTGVDYIFAKMLKMSGKAVSGILVEIFNYSIEKSVFHVQWKKGVITPVFQKGNFCNVNNYHTISLLSVFSKAFEKIIAEKLCQRPEENSILSRAQFGFRRELKALFLGSPNFYLSPGKIRCSVTTIDLNKAFKCLSHTLLLSQIDTLVSPQAAS